MLNSAKLAKGIVGPVMPVLAGIASGVLLIAIFSASFNSAGLPITEEDTSLAPSSSETSNWCHASLEYIKSHASFPVLTPTELPEGYSLQRADVGPENVVYLYYFTRTMCNPDDIVRPEEGVIEIVEGPLDSGSSVRSGSEYVEKQQAEYKMGGVPAKTFIFDNGMHAIGYESATVSSPITDQNNSTVATTQYKRLAALWVVDDETGTICKIQARSELHSLEDLVKIGQSLTV